MQGKPRYLDIAFILLLIAIPFLSLPWYHGIGIADPAEYIKSANSLLQGQWTVLENFWSNRIASCIPYAIGMAFFGITEYLSLVTTIELMALLVLIYVVIGKYNKGVAFMSVVMLGTSPTLLRWGSEISSDIMITLMANAVVLVWFYLRQQPPPSSKKAIAWGIMTAGVFCIAFLSKESIAFFVPLLLYYAFTDYRQPAMRRFWLWAGLTLACFVGAILIFYAVKTGDAFYRFRIVETGPSASEVNYNVAAFSEIIKRCTYQPLQFIIRDSTFSVLFILSVLHLFMPSRSSEQQLVKKYFLFTIILWWFGSQSISSWNPVGLVYRLWLPLLVSMAINSAYAIYYLILEPSDTGLFKRFKYSLLLTLLLLAAWVAFYTSYKSYESIGRPKYESAALVSNVIWVSLLIAIVLVFTWAKNAAPKNILHKGMIFLVILFPAVNELHSSGVWYWVDKDSRWINEFRAERKMVLELDSLPPAMILAEPLLCDNYGIYNGFEETLPFVKFNDIHQDSIPAGSYMLLNEKRMQFLKDNLTESTGFKMRKRGVPDFAYFPEKYGFEVIRQESVCKLYQKTGLNGF